MDDTPVLKEGELIKSPPNKRDSFGRLKSWRKRYIVLKKSRLSYYLDWQAYRINAKSKGYINMEDCIYVTLQSTPKFKRDFIVSLTTKEESTHKGRVFHFCSKNQIEQKEWFTALKNCIKQPIELSDDDNASQDEVLPHVFKPSAPTPLQSSIEAEKRKLSTAVEIDRSGSFAVELEYPVYSGDVAENEIQDEGLDEKFESLRVEEREEVEGCIKVKELDDKRNSQRSSGYESLPRDSICSRYSQLSDVWEAGDESGIWSEARVQSESNLFEFSAKFEGPRCTTKVKTMFKAKSMGDLFSRSDSDSQMNTWETPKRRDGRGPSLQDQVNMILRYSGGRKDSIVSSLSEESSEEPLYENIPVRCEERGGELGSELGRPGRTPGKAARPPRPRSEPSRRGSHGEKNRDSPRRKLSCGSTGCSTRIEGNIGRANIDFDMDFSVWSSQNLGPQKDRRPMPRPPSMGRQCSTIDEKPETPQVRSGSDPTDKRRRKNNIVTLAYL